MSLSAKRLPIKATLEILMAKIERPNDPSAMVSEYHHWFRDLGYPSLDLHQMRDGSWYILEYLNTPLIPSLTKWNMVLGYMKNTEISKGFIAKYLDSIDPKKQALWAREEAATKEVFREQAELERHNKEVADTYAGMVLKNDALKDRICRNGLHEMLPHNIFKHVPKHYLRS